MKIPLVAEVAIPKEIEDDLSVVVPLLEVAEEEPSEGESCLIYTSAGLQYLDSGISLHLDFSSSQYKFYQAAGAKKDPVLRAIGKLGEGEYLFDATAGYGRDALYFSRNGYRVVACESSPIMYLLLQDALRRCQTAPFSLYYGDSASVITTFEQKPAVAYLDPMFPEQKKSSLPRKEMQIMRRCIDDHHGEGLVPACLGHVKERVVVKRPIKAEPLFSNPNYALPGKIVRFDVYLPRKDPLRG